MEQIFVNDSERLWNLNYMDLIGIWVITGRCLRIVRIISRILLTHQFLVNDSPKSVVQVANQSNSFFA